MEGGRERGSRGLVGSAAKASEQAGNAGVIHWVSKSLLLFQREFRDQYVNGLILRS